MKLPFALSLTALLALLPSVALAAEFTVTKTEDTADGTCDADCSLREAIFAANAMSDADTITVPAGTYTLTIAGIDEDSGATGDLDITDNVTIRGAGVDQTVIDGAGIDRVFHVAAFAFGALEGMTIQNGDPTASGVDAGGGGVLVSSGEFELRNVRLTGNSADRGAGALVADSSELVLLGVTADGNDASEAGGGAATRNEAEIRIRDSSFTSNTAVDVGGGVEIGQGSQGLVSNTVFDQNDVTGEFGVGGGLRVGSGSSAGVTDVVLTGNTAAESGGGLAVVSGGLALITDVVITGNEAPFGAGLAVRSGGDADLLGGNISGNSSVDAGQFGHALEGGGIGVRSGGSLLAERVSVWNNDSGEGGGLSVLSSGLLQLVNSTVANNFAALDGGTAWVANAGDLVLISTTAAANTTAGLVAGIRVVDAFGLTSFELEQSILANGDATRTDCSADVPTDVISRGYNFVAESGNCMASFGGNDQVGTSAAVLDPGLQALAEVGGIRVMIPDADAAVVDAGPAVCAQSEDQRLRMRPSRAACDIGAIEIGECGDGFNDADEECDDGNTVDGDGCASDCTFEAGAGTTGGTDGTGTDTGTTVADDSTGEDGDIGSGTSQGDDGTTTGMTGSGTTGGGPSTGDEASGTASGGTVTAGGDTTSGSDESGGSSGDGGASGDDGGCGCTTDPVHGGAGAALFGLLLFGLRRRRS